MRILGTDVTQPFGAIIAIAWFWVISWVLAAFWSRRATARASIAQEIPYRVVVGSGLLAMFYEPFWSRYGLLVPLWRLPINAQWVCVGFVAAGGLFAWWARIHLGVLWSGNVTRKEDHRIVDTGPYGIVRHPIYTGILLSLLATAIAMGTANGFAGLAVVYLGFYIKARLEERFLREGLGPEAYDAYAARVPMLIPFWPMKTAA